MVFPSHVWMWELGHKESWALKNRCFWTVVFKKTLESPLDCKEIKPVNSKGYSLEYCWERLKAGGEEDDRGWDGGMASSTQWIWVWASSKSWWWTRKPGMLLPMGLKESGTTERLTELGSLCQKSRTEIGTLFTYSRNVIYLLFHGMILCVCVCVFCC